MFIQWLNVLLYQSFFKRGSILNRFPHLSKLTYTNFDYTSRTDQK